MLAHITKEEVPYHDQFHERDWEHAVEEIKSIDATVLTNDEEILAVVIGTKDKLKTVRSELLEKVNENLDAKTSVEDATKYVSATLLKKTL